MLHTNPPRKFKNIDEKWRQCYLEKPRYYPESQLIKAEDGHWYCRDCYEFRFRKQQLDEVKIRGLKDDLE